MKKQTVKIMKNENGEILPAISELSNNHLLGLMLLSLNPSRDSAWIIEYRDEAGQELKRRKVKPTPICK